jgi:hypothetical protein
MCAIRAKLTGVCSTRYVAASSGAFFSSNCENSTNLLQYDRNTKNFTEASGKETGRMLPVNGPLRST